MLEVFKFENIVYTLRYVVRYRDEDPNFFPSEPYPAQLLKIGSLDIKFDFTNHHFKFELVDFGYNLFKINIIL